MLPATWTAVKRLDPNASDDSSLMQLSSWWSSNPSQVAGIGSKKGQIAKGFDADFVVKPYCHLCLMQQFSLCICICLLCALQFWGHHVCHVWFPATGSTSFICFAVCSTVLSVFWVPLPASESCIENCCMPMLMLSDLHFSLYYMAASLCML